MSKLVLSWGLFGVAVAGFLGLRWWDETRLWDAARIYYLGPYTWAPERLEETKALCEQAALAEGIVADGEWQDKPGLSRGSSLDLPDDLVWERDYRFEVYFVKLDARHNLIATCNFDGDRREVREVTAI